eukprot:TRINITY_DN107174_c0_g1_i1.p1 TRINITY_DN107174_c0_g1~~TRINITY_DN107174_c0_g1_i1.p1  ORF type:complete len:427 (+),score=64.55 TRINITY_DN107174_c0_g1_i1:103-1383(+)
MAAAAAAVVGTRRGSARSSRLGHGGLHRHSGRSYRGSSFPSEKDILDNLDSDKAWSPMIFGATCACTVLMLAGFATLVAGIVNHREGDVQAYDDNVHLWTDEMRPALDNSHFSLSVMLPAPPGGDGQPIAVAADLQHTKTQSWSFHDAEKEKGIEAFEPLKLTASLELPCYYRNCSLVAATAAHESVPRDAWDETQVMPLWTESTESLRATFAFTATAADGKTTTFKTQSLPLVIGRVTPQRTPQPQMQCRGSSHGLYLHPGKCYHAERLVDICLTVAKDSEGGWQLHVSDDSNATYYGAGHRRTGGFGCDPKTSYEPTVYRTDPCWGPSPDRHLCERFGANHTLSITVRAWNDPFIKAAELTHSNFDFGPSQSTQIIIGIVLFCFGILAGLVPLWSCCCKNSKSSAEERASLSEAAEHTQKIGRC